MENRKKIKPEKLDHEKEQRLGLTGLASLKKKGLACRVCPSPEELAAFVEKPGRDADIMAHITGCENCYQQWLTMSQEYNRLGKGRVRQNIIHLFSTPKYLAAAGSAMAIGASIVVFFAIPSKHVSEFVVPAKQKSVILSEEVAEPPVDAVQSRTRFEEIKKSEEKQLIVPSSGSKVMMDEGGELDTLRKNVKQKAEPAPVEKEAVFLEDAMSTPQVPESFDSSAVNRPDTEAVNLERFEEKILILCSRDRLDVTAVKILLEESRENLSETAEKKLQKILDVAEEYQDEPKLFCEAAVKILKEE